MSDWSKVRVTFTDAGGKEVSAVMWTLGGDFVQNHPEGSPSDNPGYAYIEYGVDVRVEPIRELPTGLGAVIRVTSLEGEVYGDDRDLYVRDSRGWWKNCEDSAVDSRWLLDPKFADYEILSEGIVL